MNNQNPETTTEPESTSTAPQPVDPRRRLRELLSVPERDRSDEQWDEIIELEIQLAPGNRISGTDAGTGSSGRNQGGQGKAAPGGGQQQKKHRPRSSNNNNRRPRQGKPNGGSGGAGGTPPAA